MNAANAKRRIDQMIGMESRGWGDQRDALARICRTYRLSFNTLDNIRTGRSKRVFADVLDAIRVAYLEMCAREAAKWQEALRIERAKGALDADLDDLEREAAEVAAKVAAQLQRMRGEA